MQYPIVRFLLAATLFAIPATVLPAQALSAPASSAVVTPLSDAGPRIPASVAPRFAEASDLAPALMQQRASRRDVAWMAVGGAALAVGLLIGGDAGTIIAVSGGVIGLVGLFRYLQ